MRCIIAVGLTWHELIATHNVEEKTENTLERMYNSIFNTIIFITNEGDKSTLE